MQTWIAWKRLLRRWLACVVQWTACTELPVIWESDKKNKLVNPKLKLKINPKVTHIYQESPSSRSLSGRRWECKVPPEEVKSARQWAERGRSLNFRYFRFYHHFLLHLQTEAGKWESELCSTEQKLNHLENFRPALTEPEESSSDWDTRQTDRETECSR